MADPLPSAGLPVLPVKLVPYLASLVSLAAVAVQFFPPHTVAFQVASAIISLGGVLGLLSPGLRKPQAQVEAAEATGAEAAAAVTTKTAAIDVLKQ